MIDNVHDFTRRQSEVEQLLGKNDIERGIHRLMDLVRDFAPGQERVELVRRTTKLNVQFTRMEANKRTGNLSAKDENDLIGEVVDHAFEVMDALCSSTTGESAHA